MRRRERVEEENQDADAEQYEEDIRAGKGEETEEEIYG
jgi:hypothetical protein